MLTRNGIFALNSYHLIVILAQKFDIMVQKKIIASMAVFIMIASAAFVLVADDASADSTYTERSVPIKTNMPDKPSTITVRDYADTPYVPFVTLDQIYNIHSGKTMTVTPSNDGKFTFKNPVTNETAVFDAAKGTLITKDFQKFILNVEESEAVYKFMKVEEKKELKDPAPKLLDLGAYEIPYYVEEKNVYFPLTTVNDILMNQEVLYLGYMKGTAYELNAVDVLSQGPLVQEILQGTVEDMKALSPRDAALAKFTYNELCFALDNNFGKSETSKLGPNMQKDKLDVVLDKYNSTTKKIKGWIQSTDPIEYYAGVYLLGLYLDDGGHTGYFLGLDLIEAGNPELAAKIKAVYKGEEVPQVINRGALGQTIIKPVRESIFGTDTYHEKGDTAIYALDQFSVDSQAWIDFYEKGRTGDLPNDTVGNAIKALNKAKANPAIKNFVFDFSCNTGGDSGAAMAIISLVSGDYSYYRGMFSDSGEQTYIKYIIDTNLDGKFDEKDLQKQYDFKFGIITTTAAYSCGNLVPVLLKEHGVVIIGETTGGGSHPMEAGALPDGFLYHLSSTNDMADSTWKSVETGAKPDYVLVDSFSDNPDYSVLYDIDKISELMNKSKSYDEETMRNVLTGVVVVIAIVCALAYELRKNH